LLALASAAALVVTALFACAAIPGGEDPGDHRHKEQDLKHGHELHARSLCALLSRETLCNYRTSRFPRANRTVRRFSHPHGAWPAARAPVLRATVTRDF